MMITYKKSELKAYPKLENIQVGLQVIGLKDSDYAGLKGTILDILYGDERETENDTILDILVDFVENEYSPIEITHPDLNGTSISSVICGEDELGFKLKTNGELFESAEGKVVCPHCFEVLDFIKEKQSTELLWVFKNGGYVQEYPYLSSDAKRCDDCNEPIQDIHEDYFKYEAHENK